MSYYSMTKINYPMDTEVVSDFHKGVQEWKEYLSCLQGPPMGSVLYSEFGVLIGEYSFYSGFSKEEYGSPADRMNE